MGLTLFVQVHVLRFVFATVVCVNGAGAVAAKHWWLVELVVLQRCVIHGFQRLCCTLKRSCNGSCCALVRSRYSRWRLAGHGGVQVGYCFDVDGVV